MFRESRENQTRPLHYSWSHSLNFITLLSSSSKLTLSFCFSEFFRGTVGSMGFGQKGWEPHEESLRQHHRLYVPTHTHHCWKLLCDCSVGVGGQCQAGNISLVSCILTWSCWCWLSHWFMKTDKWTCEQEMLTRAGGNYLNDKEQVINEHIHLSIRAVSFDWRIKWFKR